MIARHFLRAVRVQDGVLHFELAEREVQPRLFRQLAGGDRLPGRAQVGDLLVEFLVLFA